MLTEIQKMNNHSSKSSLKNSSKSSFDVSLSFESDEFGYSVSSSEIFESSFPSETSKSFPEDDSFSKFGNCDSKIDFTDNKTNMEVVKTELDSEIPIPPLTEEYPSQLSSPKTSPLNSPKVTRYYMPERDAQGQGQWKFTQRSFNRASQISLPKFSRNFQERKFSHEIEYDKKTFMEHKKSDSITPFVKNMNSHCSSCNDTKVMRNGLRNTVISAENSLLVAKNSMLIDDHGLIQKKRKVKQPVIEIRKNNQVRFGAPLSVIEIITESFNFTKYIDKMDLYLELEQFNILEFAKNSFKKHKRGKLFKKMLIPVEDLVSFSFNPLKKPLLKSVPKAYSKHAVSISKFILKYTFNFLNSS